MFLTDINQIRTVKWGKPYLWDVRFHAEGDYAIPQPFNNWFPAVEVEENVLTLESYNFDAFISTYKIPKSTTLFDIKITFLDDENHTLMGWLRDWVNITILNDENYVSRVADPGVLRTIQIAKVNSKKEQIYVDSYFVYPEGALYFQGTSDSGAQMMIMTFIIVGQPGGGH